MTEIDGVQYHTPKEALSLLKKRRALRPVIEAWWRARGFSVPQSIHHFDDVAVLGKNAIVTCRYEDALFIEWATRTGFTPIWMTYARSLFSSESAFKRRLIHPTFFERRGRRHGGLVLRKRKLGAIEPNRGKLMTDVRLDCGTNVIDYHQALHRRLGYAAEAVIDLSDFYAQFDYNVRRYYWGYLSFFLAHAVLFDDYHGGEGPYRLNMKFTDEVFLPVYRAMKYEFNIAPIMVRFPWHASLGYFMPSDTQHWRAHRVIPEDLLRMSEA